jgi:hypothetical protein
MSARRSGPGIPLPVFRLRPLELGSGLAQLSHLILPERFELLGNPNIILNLSDCRAPQR